MTAAYIYGVNDDGTCVGLKQDDYGGASSRGDVLVQSGEVTVAASSSLPDVQFPVPYKPGTVPTVIVQSLTFDSSAGYAPLWAQRESVTNTEFSVVVRSMSGSIHTGDVTIAWTACGEA